jgi:hypothetical protein
MLDPSAGGQVLPLGVHDLDSRARSLSDPFSGQRREFPSDHIPAGSKSTQTASNAAPVSLPGFFPKDLDAQRKPSPSPVVVAHPPVGDVLKVTTKKVKDGKSGKKKAGTKKKKTVVSFDGERQSVSDVIAALGSKGPAPPSVIEEQDDEDEEDETAATPQPQPPTVVEPAKEQKFSPIIVNSPIAKSMTPNIEEPVRKTVTPPVIVEAVSTKPIHPPAVQISPSEASQPKMHRQEPVQAELDPEAKLRQEQAELLRQWKQAEEERELQERKKQDHLATQQLLQMQRMKYRDAEAARLRQQQLEEENRRKAELEQREKERLLSSQSSLGAIENHARVVAASASESVEEALKPSPSAARLAPGLHFPCDVAKSSFEGDLEMQRQVSLEQGLLRR